jgi:hypothetical protein
MTHGPGQPAGERGQRYSLNLNSMRVTQSVASGDKILTMRRYIIRERAVLDEKYFREQF